jgi:hypothetical protein
LEKILEKKGKNLLMALITISVKHCAQADRVRDAFCTKYILGNMATMTQHEGMSALISRSINQANVGQEGLSWLVLVMAYGHRAVYSSSRLLLVEMEGHSQEQGKSRSRGDM